MGMRGDWTARLPVLRERFAALGPDIVTLQETILTDRADQAADMLGPGYHLTQQRDRKPTARESPQPADGRSGGRSRSTSA
jgi:endonuclease/exonuclease/phosphatase family metal-dependent hydrolase